MELQVTDLNGQAVIDSREIAREIEIQHKDLLKKIRFYEEILTGAKFRPLDFFIPSTYQDVKGEKRACYLCTRKGCDMIANKLTGKKGVLFTACYVGAFYEKDEKIKSQRLEAADPKQVVESVLRMILAHDDEIKTLKGRLEAVEGFATRPTPLIQESLYLSQQAGKGEEWEKVYTHTSSVIKTRVKRICKDNGLNYVIAGPEIRKALRNDYMRPKYGTKFRTELDKEQLEQLGKDVKLWSPKTIKLKAPRKRVR